MSDIRDDSPGANAARLERQRLLAVDPKPIPAPHEGCVYILDVNNRGVAEVDIPAGPTTDDPIVVFDVVMQSASETKRLAKPKPIAVQACPPTIITSIALIAIVMIFCGMASIDLVRSMWGHQGYSVANGWLIEMLGGLFK